MPKTLNCKEMGSAERSLITDMAGVARLLTSRRTFGSLEVPPLLLLSFVVFVLQLIRASLLVYIISTMMLIVKFVVLEYRSQGAVIRLCCCC